MSAIIVHELYFGAYTGKPTNETLARLDGLRFEVLAIDTQDANRSAEIRTVLARSGNPDRPL